MHNNRYRMLAASDEESLDATPKAGANDGELLPPPQEGPSGKTTTESEKMWAAMESPPPIGTAGLDGDQARSTDEGGERNHANTTTREIARGLDNPNQQRSLVDQGRGGKARGDDEDNGDDGGDKGEAGGKSNANTNANTNARADTIASRSPSVGRREDRTRTPMAHPQNRATARLSLGPGRQTPRLHGGDTSASARRTPIPTVIPQKRPHDFSPQTDDDNRELPRLRLDSHPPPKSVRLPSFKDAFENPWKAEGERNSSAPSPQHLFAPDAMSTPKVGCRTTPFFVAETPIETNRNQNREERGSACLSQDQGLQATNQPWPQLLNPAPPLQHKTPSTSFAMDIDDPEEPEAGPGRESARPSLDDDELALLRRAPRDRSRAPANEEREAEASMRRKEDLRKILHADANASGGHHADKRYRSPAEHQIQADTLRGPGEESCSDPSLERELIST
ncbi:hypothetical protein C8Q76DRAFT_793266 [Earliella scabrosa]|nr:hypothetical protein C8Q76DRAFT_793266 [Earliella scabrosa]